MTTTITMTLTMLKTMMTKMMTTFRVKHLRAPSEHFRKDARSNTGFASNGLDTDFASSNGTDDGERSHSHADTITRVARIR